LRLCEFVVDVPKELDNVLRWTLIYLGDFGWSLRFNLPQELLQFI